MKTIKNFNFTIMASREGYENKRDAIACLSAAGSKAIKREKMAFKEITVNPSEFVELAVNGHSFCNLFQYDADKKYWIKNNKGITYCMYPEYQRGNNKGYMKVAFKADEFFKSSQVVFLDIDYTNFKEIPDYINSLTYKPTIVYMSYSDGIFKKDVNQKENPAYTIEGIKSRRFRMVYVFEDQLNKTELNNISYVLNLQIEKDTNEEIQDKCGAKVSQYFNGCFGNKETYVNDYIYSYSDFEEMINLKIEAENKEKESIITYNNNINNNNIIEDNQEEENISTTYYNDLQNWTTKESEINTDKIEESSIEEIKVEEKVENTIEEDKPLISYRLVNEMTRLSYDDFMKYNRHNYRYIYRIEKDEWINNEYQFTDENYFSLFYNVNTVKDGGKRRKKIFERMCLRRVMFPEINPDTILFDAYEDVHRFFDNSDGVLSIDCLIRNVESCFKLTVDEISEKYSNNIEYLKSKRPSIILKKGVAFDVAERNTKLKDVRYSLIDEVYNRDLSVKENLEFINNNVFSICEKTLYNYCHERGIIKKVTDEEILELYDFNLSLRKNLEYLKENGLKVSRGRLANLIKKYSEPEEVEEKVEEKVEVKPEINNEVEAEVNNDGINNEPFNYKSPDLSMFNNIERSGLL